MKVKGVRKAKEARERSGTQSRNTSKQWEWRSGGGEKRTGEEEVATAHNNKSTEPLEY